jgi:hypothetical protein
MMPVKDVAELMLMRKYGMPRSQVVRHAETLWARLDDLTKTSDTAASQNYSDARILWEIMSR